MANMFRTPAWACVLCTWLGTWGGDVCAAPFVWTDPVAPIYGQPIVARLTGAPATHIDTVRRMRAGNRITIDYDYSSEEAQFGPLPPVVGPLPMPLGELAPGDYLLEARIFDLAVPEALPLVSRWNFHVAAPEAWGVYLVPARPHAHEDFEVFVKSAAPFDPESLRATLSQGAVRVDFDYAPTTVQGGGHPPGFVNEAMLRLPGAAPGGLHVEVWGRAIGTAAAQRYFTLDAQIAQSAWVVEYYQEKLHHYFMAADPEEIALLDDPASGWRRTGQRFQAWLDAQDAPATAKPVCRFYAAGPNSHFYTLDPVECEQLWTQEQAERKALAPNARYLGWSYEGVAFHAKAPLQGKCPPLTLDVSRQYNGLGWRGDPNHRFTVDETMRSAMRGWIDEGVALCVPQ